MSTVFENYGQSKDSGPRREQKKFVDANVSQSHPNERDMIKDILMSDLDKESVKPKKPQKAAENEVVPIREYWSTQETQELIRIMEIATGTDLLDNSGLAKKNIYKKVVKIMKECGFNRSEEQISAKWQLLRTQYHKAKAGLKPSRSGTESKQQFKWYDRLDVFLGTRPAAAMEGIESVSEEALQATAQKSAAKKVTGSKTATNAENNKKKVELPTDDNEDTSTSFANIKKGSY